ncbi:MAG: hypothetical protein ABI238_04995 [Terrimesophilobacter sp.]
MKKSLTLTVGAALALFMLAGCTPAPSSSASPEPVPTVTVTVTPAPVAEPDYGFTFFHAATIGSSWAQMSAQLHMPVGPFDGCPWYGTVWSTELASTTAFLDSRNPATGATFFYTNYLLATSGASFPRNSEGVGVGSSKSEVLAAYPSAVVDTYTDLGAGNMTRITVAEPSSGSKYVFAITGSAGANVVDLLQWGPGAGSQWSHLCTGF